MADGRRVAGSGGCNRLSGGYTLEGSRLKFGPMAGTMMACPQGMEQERDLHTVLPQVVSWRIVGPTLELIDAAGTAVVTLTAAR